MRELITNVLFQALTISLMVAGWSYEVQGAQNIVRALIWLGLILLLLEALTKRTTVQMQFGGSCKLENLRFAVFFLKFGFFAWYSEFFLAALYVIVFGIGAARRAEEAKNTKEVE